MTKTETNRLDYLDCIHGLMILHMMFFHLCCSTINHTIYHYYILKPLSFFMAWFFFKAGMFYKERKVYNVVINGLKKLILPAIFFSAIGFAYYYVIEHPVTTIIEELHYFYVFGAFNGNGPIWFLYSFFIVQILYSLLRKCQINNILIILLSIGLYFTDKYIGFRSYLAYNIPLGLLYYSLGNSLKELQYKKIVIVVCTIVYTVAILFFRIKIDFHLGIFSPFIIATSFAAAGCVLVNVLFKSFPSLCMTPLRFFGCHAMEFYCTHIIIIYSIEQFLKHHTIPINDIIFEAIVFALYLIIFSLIIHQCKMKKLQWMFGNRNK